jgi:hypothetical protein
MILHFVAMAVLGGACFVLVSAKRWADLKTFRSARHILVSLIVGVLYYQLYSSYSFPNLVMSFVSGYAGPSFIQEIMERLKPKPS